MLKILVTANYKYIPSLDDILETTAVTRLRNQLLEAEHYQLAVEVRQLVVNAINTRCTPNVMQQQQQPFPPRFSKLIIFIFQNIGS